MQLVGVVGPADAGRPALVERLVDRLSGHGSVATVGRLRDAPPTDADSNSRNGFPDDADATVCIADDGGWVAAGTDRSLDQTLDELAPAHDYAVVEGYPDARIPTIALGGRGHEGEPVATAESVDGTDVENLVTAIDALEPYETLGSLVARVKRSADADRAGAIATFTGRVRRKDHADDDPTEYLTFEKYDGVADDQLAAIREDLLDREGIYDVRLHHRTGVVEAGEDIVFVVVLAGHRREAFRTVEDGIERLKDEVALFKKEVTVSHEFWAHERS